MYNMKVNAESKAFSGVNKYLLDFRICMYAACALHHSYVAYVLLNIDFSEHEDPRIRMYQHGRWKLFTTWFNIVFLAYFVLSFFCDVFEKTGRYYKTVGKFRNEMFTAILFPVSLFADAFFWQMWTMDNELIAPKLVNPLVPWYSQYSMHTLSLIVAIIDVLVVPRVRPRSMVPGLRANTAFITAYAVVTAIDINQGVYIYPFLRKFSPFGLLIFYVYSMISNYFFYTLQWCIVDVVWGKRVQSKKEL